MSFSFKLKSHPDKLLINHLRNVGKLSKDIVNSKYIDYRDVFSEIAYLIGVSHDFGKATTYFQNKLNRGKRSKYARHGFLSSFLGYYLVRNYLNKIDKLEKFWYLPAVAWIAIKRHHGNIKNIRGGLDAEISALKDLNEIENIGKQIHDIVANNMFEVKNIYEELLENFEIQEFIDEINGSDKFTKEIYKNLVKICREKSLEYYFYILFFYSVILDADKLDASERKIPTRISDIKRSIINNYKRIKFGISKEHINQVRKKAYEEVNNSIQSLDTERERILSINLPTGMGKTLTGLSFSLGLRERIVKEFGFTPRIIYCLPFLSIIDQNSEVIEEVLRIGGNYHEISSNLFLKHHHLADIEYREEKNGELNTVKDLNKSLLLMEGWNSEIVITTFVQFFHSLITNRNRAARKFHNISNSIIILDEVQSIPQKYWLLINKALKYLASKFNCWIILMTATEPLIFERSKEIKDLIKDREEYFKLFDRVEFDFDLDKDGNFNGKNFDLFADEIFNEVIKNKDKDLMVVLNTIDSCKKLYEYLKEKLSIYNLDAGQSLDNDGVCNFPDLELITLSTHILPTFRLNRINRIKKKNKRKVVITTQLIEAGVDISVDILYRDLAPLDCIIQSAGRCNRNNKKQKGIINVILLKDKNGRPFCSYIYDRVLLGATQEIIKEFGKRVSEKDFIVKAADKYYELAKERGTKDKSKTILDYLKKLNFSDIIEFRLIEERLPSITMFVEIDKKAENTRKEIERILAQEKGFKKRESRLKIRRDINQYTISISPSRRMESIVHLPTLGEETFKYIPRKELKKWYKLDIGFSAPENDVSMRII